MPVEALSLLGLLDRDPAMLHLETDCCLDDPSTANRHRIWEAARAALGPPVAASGQAEIQELPPQAWSYIRQHVEPLALKLGLYAAPDLSPPRYCLVEIGPLLATQLVVRRGDDAMPKAERNPQDMLELCLPATIDTARLDISMQAHAIIIKAASPNLRLQPQTLPGQGACLVAGEAPPFVTVVERGGLLYLWDGHHRATDLMRAGATHMPCMLRQSLREDLTRPVLERVFAGPVATIGHFARGHPVRLRRTARVLHVTWSEWLLPEEEA
jgi:hypothetical protein